MANLKIIKYLAKGRGISLGQLADGVGISLGAVQKIIRENSTRIETLEKICAVLDVKVDIFFNDLHANKMTQNANRATQNVSIINNIMQIIKQKETPGFPFTSNRKFYTTIGIKQKRFNMVLRNEVSPTLDELQSIAMYFGVKLQELISFIPPIAD